MNTSAIEEIRELEAKRTSLISAAKEQALEVIQRNIELLGELGFTYDLTENVGKKSKNTRRKRRTTGKLTGECPVCEFVTNPPHDKRHHRSQEVPAPFTPAELEQRGFTVVPSEPDQATNTEATTEEDV